MNDRAYCKLARVLDALPEKFPPTANALSVALCHALKPETIDP